MPFFVCQQWITNCIDSNPNDITAQTACRSVTCGQKNASAPASSSSSSSQQAATSTSKGPAVATADSTASKGVSESPPSQTGTSSSGTVGPSGPTQSKVGLATGLAIGGVVLIALLILSCFCWGQRKKKRPDWQRRQGAPAFEAQPERPSPWPSLRRLWRTELPAQHDRPELEGSSGRRELGGASVGQQRAELSSDQSAPQMSAVSRSPLEPYELPSIPPAQEGAAELRQPP